VKRNSNPFPSVYYVYMHQCLYDRKPLYIGHGTGDRAWQINNRDKDHKNHYNDMLFEGYTPDDWVRIVVKGLTKADACEMERKLIAEHRPSFNKIQGEKLLKVTPEILEEAFNLREMNFSYAAIADTLNLATMTIHRAMHGKSPALEAVLERQI